MRTRARERELTDEVIQAELDRESSLAYSSVAQDYDSHRHDHCRTSDNKSGVARGLGAFRRRDHALASFHLEGWRGEEWRRVQRV